MEPDAMPVKALITVVQSRFDARTIGLSRVAVGLAATGQALLTQRLLLRVYEPAVVRAPLVDWVPNLPVDLVPAYLGLWLAASVGFTLGIWTPISGTLLTGVLAYQLAFDLNLYSNHVYLMLIATGLLTVAGSGRALSLDAFLRRHRGEPRTVSYACVFLLQFQVSVVYFFPGVQKLNDRFLSGAVLENVLAGGEAIPGPVLQVAAMGVILSELFLAIALWVPSWRRWAFVAGFGLHAAIPMLMPGNRNDLIVFSILMLGMYLAFLPRVPSKLVVVWDAECSFCSNWTRLARTLDWLARVEFVRAADRSALARLRAMPDQWTRSSRCSPGRARWAATMPSWRSPMCCR